MNETISSIGAACIALALLFALAGVGWWRLAVVLVVSAVLAAVAASGVGWVVWHVALSLEHGGGEWRGLFSLAMAGIATGAVFLVVFVLTIILLGATMRGIFRRSRASFILLGISALLLVGAGLAFALNTTGHASNQQLVRLLEKTWNFPEVEDELARRGRETVPVIVAELHRLETPDPNDYPPHDVPPLLRMLGRLGGAEANAELHRWAQSQSQPGILVAAGCALAAQGDHSAEPLLAQFLANRDGEWPSHYPDLLNALGQLKAAGQVGAIRDLLTARGPAWAQRPYQVTRAGVGALAAIGTDEAWAAIVELSEDQDEGRRSETVGVLQDFPGPRTVAILSKALDASEPRVREAAYWSLLRVEPRLNTAAPPPWNEVSAGKMRAALKTMEVQKPR